MFLSIYHNGSGNEYLRRVSPTEKLDLRAMVTKWADKMSDGELRPSFSELGSHIPNGCGEYQAELRYTKVGGASCWASEAFFMESI